MRVGQEGEERLGEVLLRVTLCQLLFLVDLRRSTSNHAGLRYS